MTDASREKFKAVSLAVMTAFSMSIVFFSASGVAVAGGESVVSMDSGLDQTQADGLATSGELGGVDSVATGVTFTETPNAPDESERTDEDTPLSIPDGNESDLLELASDPNDNPLSLVAIDEAEFESGTPVTLDSGATVTVNSDGSWTYDPNGQFESLNSGETATDSFTYNVTDGTNRYDQGTITITITGVNDPPMASDDSGETTEDTTLTVTDTGALLGLVTDPDDDELSLTEINGSDFTVGTPVTLESGATVTVNSDGTGTYDPNGQFESLGSGETATDRFTYNVSDGEKVDQGTITITITGVNEAPTADDDGSKETQADQFLTVGDGAQTDLLELATDPNGDSLSLAAVNGEAFDSGTSVQLESGATVSANSDGSWTYNPTGQFQELPAGETTTDSFTYNVSDGNNGFDQGTITITITGVSNADDDDDDDDDSYSPDRTPPIADAGPDKSVTVGERVVLNASNSSDNEELDVLQWDVNGDGKYEAVGETISRSFDSPGEYTVTLRVWDASSNSDTDTAIVDVSPGFGNGDDDDGPDTPTPTPTPTTTAVTTTTADAPDIQAGTASTAEDDDRERGGVDLPTSTSNPDKQAAQSTEGGTTTTVVQAADDSGSRDTGSMGGAMPLLIAGIVALVVLLVATYGVTRHIDEGAVKMEGGGGSGGGDG